MARTSRPVTVTLGEMHDRVFERVESGDYGSVSEVLRAGVRALDREDEALEAWLKRRVADMAANPDEPTRSAEEVWAALEAHHEARAKAERGGA